jgi:UDP-GlcNAc:undecaprenyl-phosphate GlcNAc-1-phosphate transferase
MKSTGIFVSILLAPVVAGAVLMRNMEHNPDVATPVAGASWLVIAAFGIAFALTPAAGHLARRFGAIDRPGGRKIHQQPTPLLGGAAIYAAFAVCVAPCALGSREVRGIFLSASLIFIVGAIEDTRGLSARVRLVFQTIAVVILIRAGVELTFLPPTWWGIAGEWMLTFFWIVGITNAFNFLDGLDGLAGGSAAINSFFIGTYAHATGQGSLAFLSLVLSAATLGFLPYNYQPHRRQGTAVIFLGDSGSTFLGFTLASLAVMGDWAEASPKDIIVPVLILAVPVFDMILTTAMRIREGLVNNFTEWIVYTGRDHFHHRLLSLGIRKKEAVAIIILINVCLGISAFLLMGANTVDAFLVLGQVTVIFGIIGYAMVVMKKRRGDIPPQKGRRWDDPPTVVKTETSNVRRTETRGMQ